MEPPTIDTNPAFLEYVYQLTAGKELPEALESGLQDIRDIDFEQWQRIGLRTYAPGKWSLHKIVQHLIDWERIWCFRAVIFAREEGTIPVAHDQEIMGAHSNADELPLERLLHEFQIVRQSTMLLFESFSEAMLQKRCRFFEYEMPLSAIGFTVVAHQLHHFRVIEERYLPLERES